MWEKRPVREARSPEIERATRLTAHSPAQSVADWTERDGDAESHLARPGENDANGGSPWDPEVILKEAIARLTRTLLAVPAFAPVRTPRSSLVMPVSPYAVGSLIFEGVTVSRTLAHRVTSKSGDHRTRF
jgi:hypothetical protein